MRTYRSFQEFADQVVKDDKLTKELTSDPVGTIQNIKIKDKQVYRMAMWILGIIIILIVAGSLYAFSTHEGEGEFKFPEFLITIASTAVGAIAGLISQNL